MDQYVPVAFLAALGIAANAVLTKVILRYRVCSSSLVGWLSATGSGVCAAVVVGLTGRAFPMAAWPWLAGLAVATILALLALATALQEADVSTVVPVMGVKIPLTAVLAALFLGENHPPSVYVAVVLAAAAVALFGLGHQSRAQGGRGRHPLYGISMAVAASTCYAVSDQFAKAAIDRSDPLTVLLWLWIVVGAVCFGVSRRGVYRQYKITPRDGALLVANGALALGAIGCLFWSFDLANGVTVPNIIFGTRGFFALFAGALLNQFLPLPFEKQTRAIYSLRVAGTLLMFISILVGVLAR